jgi:hypothetical protein
MIQVDIKITKSIKAKHSDDGSLELYNRIHKKIDKKICINL